MAKWSCVICGFDNIEAPAVREGMLCARCQSTWRVRATALGVLQGMGCPHVPFPEVPPNWAWKGAGISDHMALSAAFSTKFDYTNTYYHRFPRLDLLNITEDQRGFFGFVVCSDVLEHVPPPADLALQGIAHLLADHGFAILSVPSGGVENPTDEYYPDLIDWEESDGRVTWSDSSGNTHIDDDPEFHGGGGQTLAFRLWAIGDFCTRVVAAGFKAIAPVPTNDELGVPELENSGVFIAYPDR